MGYQRKYEDGRVLLVIGRSGYRHEFMDGIEVTVSNFDSSDNTYYCDDDDAGPSMCRGGWVSSDDLVDASLLDSEVAEVIASLTGQPVSKPPKRSNRPRLVAGGMQLDAKHESQTVKWRNAWRDERFSIWLVFILGLLAGGIPFLAAFRSEEALSTRIICVIAGVAIFLSIYTMEVLRVRTWYLARELTEGSRRR